MTRTQQASKQPWSDGFHTMAVDWAPDSIACEQCYTRCRAPMRGWSLYAGSRLA